MIQVGDNFNRADSATLGANWQTAPTAQEIKIVSNQIQCSNPGDAAEAATLFRLVSLGDSQFAQINLAVFTGASDIRLGTILRSNPASDYRYNCVALKNFGGGAFTTVMEKYVNGVHSDLSLESSTTWNTGDVIRFEAIGTNFRTLRNGASLQTAVDSSIEGGGWAGIIMYVGGGGSLANDQGDNWLGGDMSPLNNFNFPKPKIRDAARAGWIA